MSPLFLNWRIWLLAGLVAAFALSNFTSYRKGKHDVRQEWAAAAAVADREARSLEQARQSRADEAGRLAAAREARLRADVAGAARAAGGLRDELAALRARSQSCPAEAERTAAVGELLRQCAEAHRELAQRADRHVNDLRLLQEAWPTDSP